MRPRTSVFIALSLVCALLPSVSAQWVTFQDQTATRLVASPTLGSADVQEKDYAWDDFDQDGDIDLVVVRKQPFTSSGRFPNVLLMNVGGVLTDQTTALASASSVPGSMGFLDATNDRDVVSVDVNGDGWKDVVTATTLTQTDPQYIRVPRVYINRGNDGGGNWLGFLFDDLTRIDDIALGWQGVHRFCSVSAGDVDGDGDLDLYFGDYQQGGTRAIDINDRLLINDGTGYFSDQSAARMTAEMLESSFAMSTGMVDMNQDGKVDIIKDDALNAPQGVSISYNDSPSGTGFFGTYNTVYNFAPYHFHIGDMNNDGLPDMIFSDDGDDRYMLHAGVVGGLATFQPAQTFAYSGGGFDDGFAGNNLIVDLNNDGWKDAIVTDVDVDISGCNRRTHIYRNLGNGPSVTLQEELINSTVVGIPVGMLTGGHDVAVFDINGDGWNDIVLGRCTGTQVWINQPPIGMAFSYPTGLPAFLPPGTSQQVDVLAQGIGGVLPAPGTGVLHYSINGAPYATSPMADVSAGLYRATLPTLTACADSLRFYVSVQSTTASTFTDPPTAPTGANTAIGATGVSSLFEDNFEGVSTGWSVVNASLTAGAWQVAIPNGTTNLGQFAAPPEDGEAGAQNQRCYVTQNGVVGGAAGAADVDGGPTDLISPTFSLAGTDGFVSYSRWFYNDDLDDNLTVSISSDGVNWTPLEVVTGANENQWTVVSFRVSDFIVPSATLRVRFRTSDSPNNSVTEAAIDRFKVESFDCAVCQLDLGLLGPGSATLSMCGGDLSSGTSSDFVLQGAPAGTSGWIIASLDFTPTPVLGGTLVSTTPFLILPFTADGAGSFSLLAFPGGGGPLTVYAQGIYGDPNTPFGVGITNGLAIQFLP